PSLLSSTPPSLTTTSTPPLHDALPIYFIFRRNFPIHKLFERSCDLGLFRLTADKLSQMFGFRLHKRLRGKLTTVLERMEHGHHRSEEHTSELQSPDHLVCRLLLEKKKK